VNTLTVLIGLCAVVFVWLLVEVAKAGKRLRPAKPPIAIRPLDPTTPGASPASPIEVDTAAVIEPRARGTECRRCGEPMRVAEHRAEQFEEGDRRVIELHCPRCDFRDHRYFTIRTLH